MWGMKKKSPQTQITHTEQQAIKQHTIGRRGVTWWESVDGRGGGGALEKTQPPQWETDGLSNLK